MKILKKLKIYLLGLVCLLNSACTDSYRTSLPEISSYSQFYMSETDGTMYLFVNSVNSNPPYITVYRSIDNGLNWSVYDYIKNAHSYFFNGESLLLNDTLIFKSNPEIYNKYKLVSYSIKTKKSREVPANNFQNLDFVQNHKVYTSDRDGYCCVYDMDLNLIKSDSDSFVSGCYNFVLDDTAIYCIKGGALYDFSHHTVLSKDSIYTYEEVADAGANLLLLAHSESKINKNQLRVYNKTSHKIEAITEFEGSDVAYNLTTFDKKVISATCNKKWNSNNILFYSDGYSNHYLTWHKLDTWSMYSGGVIGQAYKNDTLYVLAINFITSCPRLYKLNVGPNSYPINDVKRIK